MIKDRKGFENPVTDYLSRIVCARDTEAPILSASLMSNYL